MADFDKALDLYRNAVENRRAWQDDTGWDRPGKHTSLRARVDKAKEVESAARDTVFALWRAATGAEGDRFKSAALWSERVEALVDAAAMVCDGCGGRAFPCYPEFREVRDGPPGSGNLVHVADAGIRQLCVAGSIWHAIAFDDLDLGGGQGARAMEALQARGFNRGR